MRSLLSDGLALLIIQDAGIPVKARVLADAGNPYDGAEQKNEKNAGQNVLFCPALPFLNPFISESAVRHFDRRGYPRSV